MNSTFSNIVLTECSLMIIDGPKENFLFSNVLFSNITLLSKTQGMSIIIIQNSNYALNVNFCIFDSLQACK